MGHGAVADEIKGRAAQAARRRARRRDPLDRGGGRDVPLLPRRLARSSWGRRPRWRSRRRSARTSRSCSTSARRSTPTASTPPRSTERTHRWLDRCLAWHDEHGPEGQVVYGIVQGGVDEDLRRASAQEVAARDVGGIAIGGTLGEDKDQMFERRRTGRSTSCDEAPAAAPARDRRGRRPGARRRARHRHVRLRDADPDRPPRDGHRARPGASAGAWTWPRRAGATADEPLLEGCPCPACEAGYSRAYLHYLLQGARADRPAAADDPQPRLPRSG